MEIILGNIFCALCALAGAAMMAIFSVREFRFHKHQGTRVLIVGQAALVQSFLGFVFILCTKDVAEAMGWIL